MNIRTICYVKVIVLFTRTGDVIGDDTSTNKSDFPREVVVVMLLKTIYFSMQRPKPIESVVVLRFELSMDSFGIFIQIHFLKQNGIYFSI